MKKIEEKKKGADPPGRRLQGLLPVLALPLLWELTSRLLATPLLPGPLAVIRHLVLTGGWLPHLGASLARMGSGMALAAAAALPLGIMAAGKGRTARAVSLLGTLGYPIPKVVLLPPLVLLLGVGELPKVLLIFLVLFFPLLTAVRDALRSLPDAWFLSLASLGIPRRKRFPDRFTLRYLILPGLLPAALSSLRISLGIAAAVLFFTENFGTALGMGQFIMDARVRVDYPDLYGGILVLSLAVLLLYLILDGLELRFSPWIRSRG